MKPNILHYIVVGVAAWLLTSLTACTQQEISSPDMVEASLYLNVATLESTRAGTGELPENEKMKSVRVVVLHADGSIEHNKYFPLSSAQESKFILLKVKPNEDKKIYLFANEEWVSSIEGVTDSKESLSSFFDSFAENALGFADEVDNLYFEPDYKSGTCIPMSSMYELSEEELKEGVVEKTYYVVRVATKFMVNFKNWRDEAVTITNFTISSHADKNYLMAHVNDSEQNQTLFNKKTWIEWLKEVSEASSENDSYDTTEAAGWLKDYELPGANLKETYTSQELKVGAPTVDLDDSSNSKPGEQTTVFYLPESKNLKSGTTDGEQEYTMTLNIAGKADPVTFTLPNLKALFRNTHVIINITMYGLLDIQVDVIPYSEIVLDPIFGLNPID